MGSKLIVILFRSSERNKMIKEDKVKVSSTSILLFMCNWVKKVTKASRELEVKIDEERSTKKRRTGEPRTPQRLHRRLS